MFTFDRPWLHQKMSIEEFLACHSCGLEFLVDDSDPKAGYHVRNFSRSAEIKRQLIAEGREMP